MGLEGKVAVVTGAGAGIGRSIARAFARAGATVVVNDVSPDGGAETVAALDGAGHAIAADVADAARVEAMHAEIDERFGGSDVLVNNAGVAEGAPGELARVNETATRILAEGSTGQPATTHWETLTTITDESWQRMLAVHLSGTFFNMRAAVPRMIRRGGGAIVNISSASALVGTPGNPHYSAAKAGILGLTRAVAAEVGSRGVRVNAICPGLIDTPAQRAGLNDAMRTVLAAQAPLGRVGQPDEIAAAALFLASDASSYLTGQTLEVSGGIHM